MDDLNKNEILLIMSGFIAITSAIFATVVNAVRRSSIFLWICGLSMGGVYLSFGAEYLAVIQWIVSTLVGISFIFYSIMFGEKEPNQKWLRVVPGFLITVSLVLILSIATQDLPVFLEKSSKPASLLDIGKILIYEDFISLIFLALTLLMVVVGVGSISRPEEDH